MRKHLLSKSDTPPGRHSTWAPLRRPAFRSFWTAQLGANLGLWIQTVGGSWLMATIAPSADLVALVWAVTYLSILCFSLLGGALADSLDRRTVMLAGQATMLAASLVLAGLEQVGQLTPWLLLLLTFIFESGGALRQPAFSAAAGEMVPVAEVPAAVALTSVNFNLARSVGPGIGGLVVAWGGPVAAFLICALGSASAIVAVLRWRPPPMTRSAAREGIGRAMLTGLRYCLDTASIRIVLIRSGVLGLAASAAWALMPLVAKQSLAGTPFLYGVMLGAMGVGSVIGASFVPAARLKFGSDAIVLLATLAFALLSAGLALLDSLVLLLPLLVLGGTAWLAALSTFNTIVQLEAPDQLRARALSCYFTTVYGLMGVGSWLAGQLADAIGLRATLLAAAAALLGSLLFGLMPLAVSPPPGARRP